MNWLNKTVRSIESWKHNPILQATLLFLLAVLSFSLLFSSVQPEKLDVQQFSVAETTIRSPKTVEDPVETAEKKKKAVSSVEDVYTPNEEYVKKRVKIVEDIFAGAEDVVEAGLKNEEAGDGEEAEVLNDPKDHLKNLRSRLSGTINKDISDETLIYLLGSSKADLALAKDITKTSVNDMMKAGIRANEVENAKKKVEEQIKYNSLSTANLRSAAIDIGRYAIIQNIFFDSAATETAREKAEEDVEPVRILQGQIIVEEGYLIDAEVYRQLKLVGLLESEELFLPYLGLGAILILTFGGIYLLFRKVETPDHVRDNIFIFALVYVIGITLMKIIHITAKLSDETLAYLFPSAMAVMLITILMRERYAAGIGILLSVIGSIMFKDGLSGSVQGSFALYLLISGLVGILLLRQHHERSSILRAGLLNALINLVLITGLYWINGADVPYIWMAIVAISSGIISAISTIGLLPFFESSFGIFSSMKMIELSNPNHPLLRKILMEAPGTYHHSVMVANLAEGACEAVGANGLLARVGCYYHDIGKTKRPAYFIENQTNIENPHDRLSPEKSAKIILAHATDGAQMARKHKMPKEIIDIIEQHHGTTLLKYFYHKAKEEGLAPEEKDYRYKGPKPRTKEAAIISIADSVEAAVRSLKNPTQNSIEKLVKSIIVDKLNDGQFNECDITLKELEKVNVSLCETLAGIFHNRIEYPTLDDKE